LAAKKKGMKESIYSELHSNSKIKNAYLKLHIPCLSYYGKLNFSFEKCLNYTIFQSNFENYNFLPRKR
jgi:hypothetical protein